MGTSLDAVVPARICYRDIMAKQLTIRRVPEDVAERLKQLSEDRGESVNTIVLEILERAVGVDERRAYLEKYATWTDRDLEEFNEALARQRVVDDELWD